MKEFMSINDILDFAIDEEQKAVDFYSELAENANSDEMREVFEEFAKEEVKHKTRLIGVKEKGLFEVNPEKIADLKIADYLVNVNASTNMTYQDALVLAMNKEKSAFKLYINLSERAPNQEMKDLFMSLAQEESKHKLRFEIEYDDHIFQEN